MKKINCVLLVDDDNINNFINERLLKKLNITHNVKVAMNGEEALDFLKSNAENLFPELILLDINMPEMNGIEFLKNFKKMVLDYNIRVILLTGIVTPEIRKKLASLGYADVIEKPFSEEKLWSILRKDLMKVNK